MSFIKRLVQTQCATNSIYLFEVVLRSLAVFLNPILSLYRFIKVRRIGKLASHWRFCSEMDVEQLAHPVIRRSQQGSFELRLVNHAYGHARVLKSYVGLPDIYPIKVCYDHGVSGSCFGFDPQLPPIRTYDFRIPVFLAWGNHYKEMMKKYRPENTVFVVGTPFLYAENLFSETYIRREKERLGRNLIVFPAHSTRSTEADYDTEKFASDIRSHAKDFDSIRICLYFKDVQAGVHKDYMNYGFECVCAGQYLDYNFISRLKGILSISDAVLTNSIGSHIGYGIAMDKPVFFLDMDVFFHVSGGDARTRSYYKNYLDYVVPDFKKIASVLATNHDWAITEEHKSVIEPFWGLNEKKTKEELSDIFFEAEKLFEKSPYRHNFLTFR